MPDCSRNLITELINHQYTETMESSEVTIEPSRSKLQLIEDFMKQQDELDAQNLAQMKSFDQPPLTKKQKKYLIAAEQEALNARANAILAEIGHCNWVGKLQGKKIHYLPDVLRGLQLTF
jgi:hypothetical protein